MRGLVYAELRAASKYTYLLNVDGELVSPVENATIRVNLDEPPAMIAVLDGQGSCGTCFSGRDWWVSDGCAGGRDLTADRLDTSRYFLSPQIMQDSWDNWNEERDQAAADQAADRTEARDNFEGDQGYGWSDLDANGSWYDVPGQGQVWQPTVALDPNFDPYGYGSWVWSPGAGYVWASGYGWGWTPFRCGNWSFWGGFGWGWMPGVNCGFGGWGFRGRGLRDQYYPATVWLSSASVPSPWTRKQPSDCAGASGAHSVSAFAVGSRAAHHRRPCGGAVAADWQHIYLQGRQRCRRFADAGLSGGPGEPSAGDGEYSRCGSRVRHRPGVSGALVRTDRTPEGSAPAVPGQPARPIAPAVPSTHSSQGEQYHAAPRSVRVRTSFDGPPPPPRPAYAPPPRPIYSSPPSRPSSTPAPRLQRRVRRLPLPGLGRG